jgi:surface polysaccharide O-acyltransferase-like enzyme
MGNDAVAPGRIPSIDSLRAVAVFAVILMHTVPFNGSFPLLLQGDGSMLLKGTLEFAINQFVRFAVPFFFIIAGYFYGVKSRSAESRHGWQVSYVKRMVTIWLFWSIIYLLSFILFPKGVIRQQAMGYGDIAHSLWLYYQANPLHLLTISGHLWFFPALLVAFFVIDLFRRMHMQNAVLPIVVAMYGIVLLLTSYAMESSWSTLSAVLARVNTLRVRNIEVVCAYVYGLLYTAIGVALADKRMQASRRVSLSIVAAGLLLSIAEVLFIEHYTDISPEDIQFLIGTIPLATGLAILAISHPEIGRNSFLARCGRYTLGIYVCHVIFLRMLLALDSGIEGTAWELVVPVVVWFLSLMLVLVLSRIAVLKQYIL